MRNFGLNSARPDSTGTPSGRAHAPIRWRSLNSPWDAPLPQGSLHSCDVANPPLEIGARFGVVLFITALVAFFILAFYVVSFLFGA